MSDLSKQNLAVHGGSINNEDNQQKNQEKKLPRESFEEFCKRLGIKLVRGRRGARSSHRSMVGTFRTRSRCQSSIKIVLRRVPT
jgi:hypothetical protein